MAIVLKKSIGEQIQWALWEITESEQTLCQEFTSHCDVTDKLAHITHPLKRREYLASRALLRQLLVEQGVDLCSIAKDQNGKPYFPDCQCKFSLSHSAQYAAAVLSQDAIGIDLEPITPKILHLAPRFLSEKELPYALTSATHATVYWCAKEAMYKLFNQTASSLRDHFWVENFELVGNTDAPNFTIGRLQTPDFEGKAQLQFQIWDNHVVALAWPI
ncbi:4'-phosphopantetheinyl transferase superfamily protein [Flexibacter flexilis DSM 6793]|uniref:4'-phosphopantetheinyl transferase superfamily protein n=1 Tax=Flexibacter flexilis DSM 6793 TaxID=927664 RepID=A0A1I1D968_9BACT|nr:4'-phosphopantetheinyl transferase family protein [Flexibacter flexilis]SFB71337.1 4'-phosphopantetheinyl transferase superfamily protein [Flexibacter flexilis DSM 6793]